MREKNEVRNKERRKNGRKEAQESKGRLVGRHVASSHNSYFHTHCLIIAAYNFWVSVN
jgi:hypothetical protein